ncbi:MAG TPA: lipocalin family protein [Rudaea sp.]|nr:lipocalin family protein [Rudaea sp.]
MGLRRVIAAVVLWFAVGAVLYACSDTDARDLPPLGTQAKIDLKRYMGAWYVIANVPYFAERGKIASRDVYRLDEDGNVATTYVYRKSFDGPEKTVASLGVVQPGTDNAYWKVRFLWLFNADYLVLDVAPDYSWVLVGQPDRKLGWILARDPAMDDALYTSLLDRFAAFGYARTRFARVPQFKDQQGQPGFQ